MGLVDAAIKVFDIIVCLTLEDTFVFYVCIFHANYRRQIILVNAGKACGKFVRFRNNDCPILDGTWAYSMIWTSIGSLQK